MPPFEMVLKNPKLRSYRFTALLLVVINLSAFVFISTSDTQFWNATLSFALLFIYIIYRWVIQRKTHGEFYFDPFAFLIIAGCWVILQHYWAAGLSLILGGMYYLSMQKIELVFEDGCIRKLHFPGRKIEWNSLNNVKLRDGILTLDFKNNKLLQQEIEEDPRISERDFNQFAQTRLRETPSGNS